MEMDLEEYQRRAAVISGLYAICKVLASHNEALLPLEGTHSNMRIYCHKEEDWEKTVLAFGCQNTQTDRISYDPDKWIVFTPYPDFKFQILGSHTVKLGIPDKPKKQHANIAECLHEISLEEGMPS